MNAHLIDLGRMEYRAAWECQREAEKRVWGGDDDCLLLVEHDPVLTLSPGFHLQNLLLTPDEYASRGIALEQTDRGGDVTYHGTGQLTIYPVFDLSRHGKDLHKWLRDLEEVIIVALREFGIAGRRFAPHTGVWIGEEKVAAIGVKIRRWVSTHGIALNCASDLSAFETIIPCGIKGYGVTSMSVAVGHEVSVEEAKPAVARAFSEVFSVTFCD